MGVVLVEDIQVNLASHHAALQAIGVFAAAQGWTVNDNLQNVNWEDIGGGTFGFAAGSESYLELESTGEHGNQFLHFRFRGEAAGATANHEWVRFGGMEAGDTGKDTTSSVHPVFRASNGNPNWNTREDVSLNPNSIPKLFLFGNDYFIMAVFELDSTTVSFLTFGSLTVEDTTETEGMILPYQHIGATSTFHWFNRNHVNPFDLESGFLFIDGEEKLTAEIAPNIIGNVNNVTVSGEFFRYAHFLNYTNSYSGIKPMMSPSYLAKFDGDGKWKKVGEMPIFRMRSEGFQIGEKIDFGGKEFRIFPNVRSGERVHGVAVRIL